IKAAAAKFKAAGRAIGGGFGVPAGGFIESAATPGIHNAEDAGHRLIADVDNGIAGKLQRPRAPVTPGKSGADATPPQVDQSLEARILQIQTGVDHTVDHAFDRIDLMIGHLDKDAQQMLENAELAGQHLIQQLDKTAADNLAKVDKIF